MRDIKTSRAFEYAKAAHGSINHKRKYSDEPYILHPMAVAKILEDEGVTDEDIISAALLHDVLEDVWPENPVYRPDSIRELFGTDVLAYVIELTDEFTSERYPELNRAARKKCEAERIALISDGALKVKLADLIHNTADISKHDPGFARVYFIEKERILSGLHPRMVDCKDPVLLSLYNRAKAQVLTHSRQQATKE